MPIIKSAIKQMKQNRVNRVRNKHYGSHMKSMIKLILGYVESGELEKAKKLLPDVIRSIDMASKKNIIHENNAAHKKSRVQKALNNPPEKKAEKAEKVEKKAAKKTEKAEKKVEEKVEKKMEEKAEKKEEKKEETKKDDIPKSS
jgi:small subunit ribosomal protein S20